MIAVNKKARFNYELGERVEAGMVLSGAEAKAARLGQVDLGNAHVKILADGAWVMGMHIFPYKFADNEKYDPQKSRKLLLNKKELSALQMKMRSKRLLLVPTAMYTKGGRVKLELALARGKRKYEKKEAIKERDLEREMR